MNTCATCERLEKRWCMEVASAIRYPDKQSCTEHEPKTDKKKVLIRLSLSRNGSHYWIDKPATEGISSNNVHFVRWLTPDDMKKIMNGEEIEI